MSQKILVSTNYKNQGQSIQGKKEEGEKRWQGEESNQNLRLKIQNNKLLWYFSLKVKWKYNNSPTPPLTGSGLRYSLMSSYIESTWKKFKIHI